MDVAIIGCGYVGLVTGTCLAAIGHTVKGVEKDPRKLKTLQDGHCPIFEPGLQELLNENYASGQIQFTGNVKDAVRDAEVVFLCVGTPPKPDGTVDMSFLEGAGKEVCDALAEMNSEYLVTIVVKSTVPAGTNRKLYNFLREQTKAHVQVVSNPEFLKEGTAVQDCMNPDRIVIGGESPEAFRMMRRLYDPLIKREDNFMTMNWESAELTKYAANSMLAARISFMNEMTILCEFYGADVEDIRKGIGSDNRIGPAFLRAGCGYGGSCFPKDVAAMEHISKAAGYENLFTNAIQTVNKNQKKRFVDKIEAKLGRPIAGATIAVWGLAFKADTDDIRESAALDVIQYLLDKGATVRAHDYKGMEHMKQVFKDQVEWCTDPVTAAAGADAVALTTDWPQYTTLPFRKIAATMNQPMIFDGRNCLHRDVMRENGFQYFPMGRPPVENKLRLKNKV
ncbi:UDP-glucose dehydrogenase family protein [Humisphaera borealis]|uniref:UDP-glucose 6-dehydrogenase n=1 Tax=Humisphaera borealis TaxID=2807512 RepID=A0A7M2X391_9BACT|nr:UDP-glucose/GDP-mannose dehydrogenase family protein [Humisphaera borealis]QOV92145.1 UDP-glucose/GDP-mannose dehydrogenase family protein [Humisphaera borealis]